MDADPKESSEENAESTANNGELPSQQSEGANGFTSNSSSVSSNFTYYTRLSSLYKSSLL